MLKAQLDIAFIEAVRLFAYNYLMEALYQELLLFRLSLNSDECTGGTKVPRRKYCLTWCTINARALLYVRSLR